MLTAVRKVFAIASVITFGLVVSSPDNLPGGEPDVKETVVQANNQFAFDLYRELADENAGENVFFSPYSNSSVLAMTLEGAREETALQAGRVMRLPERFRRDGEISQSKPWKTEAVHSGVSQLNRNLQLTTRSNDNEALQKQIKELRHELTEQMNAAERMFDQPGSIGFKRRIEKAKEIAAKIRSLSRMIGEDICIANTLWSTRSHPLRKNYVDTISRHYTTGRVSSFDFARRPADLQPEMNEWLSKQTGGRIRNIPAPRTLNRDTRLVLTSAIYFKGAWATPFNAHQTKRLPFTLQNGDTVKTPMMFAPALPSARYGQFDGEGAIRDWGVKRTRVAVDPDGFSMVALPYRHGRLSMILLAPDDPRRLPVLEEKLTAARVNKWITQLRNCATNVRIPKFAMEECYTLGDADRPSTLQRMGMVRAFVDPQDKGGAQLGGMFASSDPRHMLNISKVYHQAVIEVDEKGTEAAAASSVLGGLAATEPETTADFSADRAFIFLIRERSTGVLLFMGRLAKPEARKQYREKQTMRIVIQQAAISWCIFMCIEFALGFFRQTILANFCSNAVLEIFGLTTGIAVAAAISYWFTAKGWLSAKPTRLLLTGLLWALFTVAFEFVFFGLVVGLSWSELTASYQIDEGRLFPVGLVSLLVIPYIFGRLSALNFGRAGFLTYLRRR